jgi:hypothetical protein
MEWVTQNSILVIIALLAVCTFCLIRIAAMFAQSLGALQDIRELFLWVYKEDHPKIEEAFTIAKLKGQIEL